MLESYLVKKKEMELFSKFDRIILYSKNEIKTISNKFKKKIYFLTESIDKINKDKFVFSKKIIKLYLLVTLITFQIFLHVRNLFIVLFQG